MSLIMDEFIKNISETAFEKNKIELDLYSRYDVKRGLRNVDNTGVLVGLTEIGDVHGYIIDEKEKIPVEGRLLYRGIDINDIVEGFQKEKRYGYEEVCYLLLFGELPDKQTLDQFSGLLDENRDLPDGFTENMILKAPSTDIMNKLARSVLVSYSYDPNPDDITISNIIRQSIELIARFPTMTAYGYQAKVHYHDKKSLFIHNPQKGIGTSENFLSMIRPDMKYSALEAEVLDLALVLHAEHGGGNNSTFSIHVVSSTDTDTYSAIAAGVGSLRGPKHGGANIKVTQMVENIKANVKDWSSEKELKNYLIKILKKEAFDNSGLIYGIGHAVYTLSDPRAVILKEKVKQLSREKGREEEFQLLDMIEKLTPETFAEVRGLEKELSPNVDFYSGFLYSLLNIPIELFTPIFAIARVSGWCAHRIEELVSGGRIIRPAYKNVSFKKSYIPMNQRSSSLSVNN